MKATLRAIIDSAPLDEVLDAVLRLEWLPEFGMNDDLSLLSKQAIAVRDAEIAASQASIKFRSTAAGILENCQKHWSSEDISKATGYRP